MSRKDYKLIARCIREQYDECDTQEQIIAIRLLTYKLCTALKSDNPDFDRDRFIAAALG